MRRAARAAAGLFPVAAFTLLAACDAGRRADSTAAPPPGYIVDSIHPPEEALRRFRVGVDSVPALSGPASRDELFLRFARALSDGDTAALRRLALDRAEFAWLVYPESKLSRSPYRQPPDVAWIMLQQASASGLHKLWARADSLEALGLQCPDAGEVEGRTRMLSHCTVRARWSGAVRDVRLFGRLVVLDGRWKIVGFDGDL